MLAASRQKRGTHQILSIPRTRDPSQPGAGLQNDGAAHPLLHHYVDGRFLVAISIERAIRQRAQLQL